MEHFYAVSNGNVAPDTIAPAGSGSNPRIAISSIVIPELIDRPQLVVRTTGHEIAVLENHRWAEPLGVDLTRAVADDLRRARPGFSVVVADAPRTRAAPLALDVVITELVTGPGPSTSLQASWLLHDRAHNCVSEGRFETAVPTKPGYDAVPSAYADAMAQLAEAIARTIPGDGVPSCQLTAGSPSDS
jgi:uncharacterized lipoprotein YmbA